MQLDIEASYGRMGITRNLLGLHLVLAAGFLVYLCFLDYIFVVHLDEQRSIVNELSLLIVLLPVFGCLLTYARFSVAGLSRCFIACSISFVLLSITGAVQYLWVATHFHSMLGGSP